MLRSSTSLLAMLLAMTAPALAADWGQEDYAPAFRDAYSIEPKDWTALGDGADPLTFEWGLRYWYSMGSQTVSNYAGDFDATDTSHSLEGHLRINDAFTNTYAKGVAGYAFSMSGDYDDPFGSGSILDGQLGYAGADLGYNLLSGQGAGFGPFAGYLYWNNSPRTTRGNFTTANSSADIGFDSGTGETFVPIDSVDNRIDVHALRLGVQGKADFGMFDITAEAAVVPYAKVGGIIGADSVATTYHLSGNIASIKSSETTFDGWGYGAMGEAFVGFHPTENLSVRLGGRAWYLQGTADATYSVATIGEPTDSDPVNPPNYDTAPSFSETHYIETANPFSMLRYGLLGEITYRF